MTRTMMMMRTTVPMPIYMGFPSRMSIFAGACGPHTTTQQREGKRRPGRLAVLLRVGGRDRNHGGLYAAVGNDPDRRHRDVPGNGDADARAVEDGARAAQD